MPRVGVGATTPPASGPSSASSCGWGSGSTLESRRPGRRPDMCGIAGVVFADRHHPIDEQLLSRMTDVMRHRGPDADGFHAGAGVGLGHRRLSIIDLSTGDQPIYNETRSAGAPFHRVYPQLAPLARAPPN